MTEQTFTAEYKATVALPGKEICYLMITALEGGANYWCGAIRSTRVGDDGNTAQVLLKEEETWENFKPFYVRWWDCESDEFDEPEDNPEGWSDPIEITKERVNDALSKLYSRKGGFDIENYDAEDGDAFFQFLLLGEIVYG